MKARCEFSLDGRIATLTLAAPKANVLDCAMIAELDAACGRLADRRDLAAVVVTGEGPNFSFGASVEEHLPDRIEQTLGALHGLLRRVAALPAPTIASVRGQCLGGGFELALACDLIVAERGATLGCPEIALGVFPPAASVLLPVRIGVARAAALILTGSSLTGEQACAAGLAAAVAETGGLESALNTLLTDRFLSRPATALRVAAASVRDAVHEALGSALARAEQRYVRELKHDADAEEGIRAFLERRAPRWPGSAARV